jgi:predicted glycoside hydrolase/deacetylase ChbG (UPF0249 family)
MSIGLHVDLPAALARGDDAAALAVELERQAARFVALTGAPPAHLDSHRDVHRNPTVLPAFVALADTLRIPLRGSSQVRRLGDFYGQWGGESHPEQLGVASLVRMFDSKLGEGVTELICHPGYVDDLLSSSYRDEREIEVATLCDPAIRAGLAERNIELVNHHDLGHKVGAVS